ncbi:MAG TPA: hypothetical protein VNN72_25270 [Polyangiaceae bacterium]|nr:hypothetical protein [Polyangiaceae bacterium]
MTTRLDPQGPAPLVHADPAAYRSTAQPTRPFQAVMTAGAAAVIGGAEAAVQRLPGGPILAAAFRPQSAQPVLTGGGAPATTPEGYPVAGSGTGVTGAGVAGAGNGTGSLDGMLDQNQDKNLYYIALQEKISAENRLYSAYSNVLRVRHETMKNAIGNFR